MAQPHDRSAHRDVSPSRRSRRLLVGLIVAGVLAAAGVVVALVSSGSASRPSYYVLARRDVEAVQYDVDGIELAAAGNHQQQVDSTCRQLSVDVKQLAALPPAPDERLRRYLAGIRQDFSTVATACLSRDYLLAGRRAAAGGPLLNDALDVIGQH